MKFRFFSICMVLVVFFIIVMILFRPAENQKSVSSGKALYGYDFERQLSLRNAQKTAFILNEMHSLVKQFTNQTNVKTDFSKVMIEQTRVAFKSMDDLRAYMGKEQVRRQVMDELLKDPKTITLANRILTDNEFVRKAYGNDQAVSRVYALELLVRKAELGDSRHLVGTAEALAKVLNNKEEISAGEFRDLEDLLYEYLKRTDLKNPGDIIEAMLSQFYYTEKLKEPFQNALFFALHSKMTEPDLSNLLIRHFGNAS